MQGHLTQGYGTLRLHYTRSQSTPRNTHHARSSPTQDHTVSGPDVTDPDYIRPRRYQAQTASDPDFTDLDCIKPRRFRSRLYQTQTVSDPDFTDPDSVKPRLGV